MLDLSYDENDAKTYIVNIEHIEDKLVITYADEHKEEYPFSSHNLHYYRISMINNAKEHINPILNNYTKETLKTVIKKYASIILSIASLYFLYNLDIHIIIKIILTILIALGELRYFVIKMIYEMFLGMDIPELLATEEYLKDPHYFEYYSKSLEDYNYIFPLEDISKYELDLEQVIAAREEVQKAKESKQDLDTLKLSYKLKNPQSS